MYAMCLLGASTVTGNWMTEKAFWL